MTRDLRHAVINYVITRRAITQIIVDYINMQETVYNKIGDMGQKIDELQTLVDELAQKGDDNNGRKE